MLLDAMIVPKPRVESPESVVVIENQGATCPLGV